MTDDPVVLVTGVTGPVGRAAAARFAANGARLALVGRDQERLEALAAELGLAPGRWVAIAGDLVADGVARSIASAVDAAFGRIDVLVHLVGGWTAGTPVISLDHDEVHSMLQRHLWTTLHVVQAVVPGMVERGFGRVIAVSSPFAAQPGPKGASYAMAKATQEVLLRSLARETAGTGVTANVLIVKAIDTEHVRETSPAPRNASWTTPGEAADAIVYLASPSAAAITGARIPLDGR